MHDYVETESKNKTMNMIIKTLYHIVYNILIYMITNNIHHGLP